MVSGIPATARLSLTAIGTPANGRGSPARIACAVASADSCATWVNALMRGSSSAIRSSEAWTSSTALSSPERISSASSIAGRVSSSGTRARLPTPVTGRRDTPNH